MNRSILVEMDCPACPTIGLEYVLHNLVVKEHILVVKHGAGTNLMALLFQLDSAELLI